MSRAFVREQDIEALEELPVRLISPQRSLFSSPPFVKFCLRRQFNLAEGRFPKNLRNSSPTLARVWRQARALAGLKLAGAK
jgi:hypothetical protein